MYIGNIGHGIYSVGHSVQEVPQPTQYFNHMHHFCELLLFVSGDVEYYIEGDRYLLKPYDMLLIPSGTYHYADIRSFAPYENYVINFDESILSPANREKLFRSPIAFNIMPDEEMMLYFKRLDKYYAQYNMQDFRACAGWLVQELLTYCCYAPRILHASAEKRNNLLRSILAYIDAHLTENIDVDILADVLKVSKSHIQNTFSQNMELGLKQYIMLKKIMAAHNDLLTGMSATAAAAKYHFNDYSTFYRSYKKNYGRSPSEEASTQRDPKIYRPV